MHRLSVLADGIDLHLCQFTQLGSPRTVVVDNAIEDLKYHCEMLDRMGIGKEGVMIIHVSLHPSHSPVSVNNC